MAAPGILVGVVGRPHGVRGLVRVQSYTAEPAALAAYSPLTDGAGRAWWLAWRGAGIAELRDAAGRPLPDRNAAARLTNTRLFVSRAQLPPAGEDEFYLADLIGARAEGVDGRALGTVTAVHDYGAGSSLEITAATGEALIVPFTRACVPAVEREAGRVVVDPPGEIDARSAA